MTRVLSPARKLRWMRLDNAAKIYPAAKRRELDELFPPVRHADGSRSIWSVLRAALDVTVRRFPSIAVRLRRGVFWYYLEQITKAPRHRGGQELSARPRPVRRCAQSARSACWFISRRIAVEFFHAVTDGTGGLIFLKTLRGGISVPEIRHFNIPAEHGVLGRLEDPDPEELEDSFLRYAGDITASRSRADRLPPERHAGAGRLSEPHDADAAGAPL